MAKREKIVRLQQYANTGIYTLRNRALYYLVDHSALERLTLDEFLGCMFHREDLRVCAEATRITGGRNHRHLWGLSAEIGFHNGNISVGVENLSQLTPITPSSHDTPLPECICYFAAAAKAELYRWEQVNKVLAELSRDHVSEAGAADAWPAILSLAKAGGYTPRELRGNKNLFVSGAIVEAMRASAEVVLGAALLPVVNAGPPVECPTFDIKVDGTTVYSGAFHVLG